MYLCSTITFETHWQTTRLEESKLFQNTRATVQCLIETSPSSGNLSCFVYREYLHAWLTFKLFTTFTTRSCQGVQRSTVFSTSVGVRTVIGIRWSPRCSATYTRWMRLLHISCRSCRKLPFGRIVTGNMSLVLSSAPISTFSRYKWALP